jgi:hypothetical protein
MGGETLQESELCQWIQGDEPSHSVFHFTLADATWCNGVTRRDLDDSAGAADLVRRALDLCEAPTPTHGLDWHNTACFHDALVGLAPLDVSGVTAAEAARAADRALELPERSVEVEIPNVNEYQVESALDSLRSRDVLRILMMDAAVPADPFEPVR